MKAVKAQRDKAKGGGAGDVAPFWAPMRCIGTRFCRSQLLGVAASNGRFLFFAVEGIPLYVGIFCDIIIGHLPR